ncbi:MAG TPA: hypothetical protein VFO16_21630 [Pseudonocardiaceae bacterium]|nr:hypothetical protein [Pseudonocardiaceae bacterium]
MVIAVLTARLLTVLSAGIPLYVFRVAGDLAEKTGINTALMTLANIVRPIG